MMPTKQTTIEIDMKTLEDILRRIDANALTKEDGETLRTLCQSYVQLTGLLKDKNTSLARLRKMLFGLQTEKTKAVLGGKEAPAAQSSEAGGTPMTSGNGEPVASTATTKKPRKGHGRNGANAYAGAEKIAVHHETLQPGDSCPNCADGTLYGIARPGVLLRIVGQPPIQARVYQLQKLRCNLCGIVITAKPPEGVGSEKYDATAGSMIGLLKYGMGIPFNRAEKAQAYFGIPLPASTQWEIVEEKAESIEPAFDELMRQAADGDVVYNDDTTVKILAMMGERARQEALAEESTNPSENDSAKTPSSRKGMFTTGIVSTVQDRKIVLFLSGRNHAGENLTEVLKHRANTLGPPIQMCDALTRNLPIGLKTIVSHCLAHGRRRFVDVIEQYPDECRYVLESLSVIYHNDATARERKLSPSARRHFHQAESGPTMEKLHQWLRRQLEERIIEPNSSLGGAISYMLKHWEKLTLFLRVPGAPLDNNICEGALKRAILHRKNALFYKTVHGAHVGDIFMSLIHTCESCGANPFDYLTELERHKTELAANPAEWMPWNYRETLSAQSTAPTA